MKGEVSKSGLGLRVILILISALMALALGGFGDIGQQARSGEQTTGPQVSFVEAPGSPIATGTAPALAIVGDFNEDGHLDLAVIYGGKGERGGVSIFVGNGEGEFAYHDSFPSGGDIPGWAAKGDFNEDGHLDLAVINSIPPNVTILLGDGKGGFSGTATFSTGGIDPYSVLTADFNEDGHLDLAIANSGVDLVTGSHHVESENVSILIGDGSGKLSDPISFLAGHIPLWLDLGDFNEDHHADLAILNRGSCNVLLLVGDGTGSFKEGAKLPFRYGISRLIVGDFNEDNHLDLAVLNDEKGDIAILLGDGAGGFELHKSFLLRGSMPEAIATGDFNEDNNLDLAIANVESNDLSILLGDGAGGFSEAGDFRVGIGPFSVTVADFNEDGRLDLVVANAQGGDITILLNAG
ncbi:MAG: FG-GAP repeat domain-containing protein [Candidatus Bipolaricaulia bacterium]